jgi:signal transduction histidine kinase
MRLTTEERCRVRVSRDRLAQAVENLLANARSFAPSGTAVDVTVIREQDHCRIEVMDRGPGIPPEHGERIFERFFSYRPDSEAERHAGLGLSIARTIVESYGGTIEGGNRPDGPGARFEIKLPAVK